MSWKLGSIFRNASMVTRWNSDFIESEELCSSCRHLSFLMTRLLYGLKELAFPILPLTDALASRIRDRLPEMVSANVSERRYSCTSKGVALRSNISQRLSRFGQRIRLQSSH